MCGGALCYTTDMLKTFLRNFLITFLVLFIVAWFVPGVEMSYPVGIRVFSWNVFVNQGLPVLLTATFFLVILTMVVRPILKVVGAPINFLTLGLFNVVISAFLFFVADLFVPGFNIFPMMIGDLRLGTIFTYVLVAVIYGGVEGIVAIMF
jgi:putative membrane protein